MSVTDDLRAANQFYYDALSTRDLAAMESLWVQTPDAVNIAPPTRPVAHAGWPAIRGNYEQFWATLVRLTVAMDAPAITVRGEVGWVHGIERTRRTGIDGNEFSGRNFGASIFIRQHGRWRMAFHQATAIVEA